MKYKLIGISSFVVLLILTIIISVFIADDNASKRVHQHLSSVKKEQCTSHKNDAFCTHLPLVKIETGGKKIPGKVTKEYDRFDNAVYTTDENGNPMIKVTISVFDNQTANNHLTDTPDFTTDSLIRVRGHSSRHFEKAPYLLKFINNEGMDNDIPVMGMDAHSEWTLHGPYLDKSLIRNYMFYNISGEMMSYAPNVRFCELFLDDDYRGIYLMVESIANGDDCRLNLSVSAKDKNIVGYLLRIDRPAEEELNATRGIYPFSERSGYLTTDMIIKYPGKDSLTEEIAKEIEAEVSGFEKALTSFDYDHNDYGYTAYIDMDNAADYFIINEFTLNVDIGSYSTYIYKQPKEKYKFCVWDFNNCADNYHDATTGYTGFFLDYKMYFRDFLRDEKFTEQVIKRYTELRKTVLSDEYINRYIDAVVEYLGPAIARNTARWTVYNEAGTLIPAERNVYSQKEAIVQLKTWLSARTAWLDENIHTIRQYSADSKVKDYNEVPY